MAREQRNRYASMSDVAEDLRRTQAGRSLLGPRSPGLRGPWSFPPETKTGRLLGAAGALVAALVLAWLLWSRPDQWVPVRPVASQPPTGIEVTNSQWEVSSFGLPQVLNWTHAAPVNWGDLPGRELLIQADNRFLRVSRKGSLIKFWPEAAPFPADLVRPFLTEGQDGGKNGLLVSWTQSTNLGIVELNENFFEGKRFSAVGAERDARDTGTASALHPLRLLTQAESHDGRKKVIAAIQTNFSKKPRGLCCFDYETGKVEWQRLVGPMLSNLEFLDADNDGFKDFICGSSSPKNGNVAEDGTDDRHSYVFAWSNAGKLLWSTNLSGTNTGTEVLTADLEGHGHRDLLAWVHRLESDHGSSNSLPSKVVQLDYHGRVVRSYLPSTCLQSCLAADLNQDGRDEIICSDCQADVYILGPHLELVRKKRVFAGGELRPGTVDRAEMRLIAARPFLKTGKLSFLVQCWMSHQDSVKNLGDLREQMDPHWYEHFEILLLDTNLETVARYALPEQRLSGVLWAVKAADMDGDGVDEILSLSDHAEILKLKK
jgi:hypothetical protein